MKKIKEGLKRIATTVLAAALIVNSVPYTVLGAEVSKPETTMQMEETLPGNDDKTTAETVEVRLPYPVFKASESVDGVRITVEADEGIFPEGAMLSVEKVTLTQEKQAEKAVESERDEDKQVAASYTYDIKVLDQDGNELQPADESKVRVSFKLDEVADENLETSVYHITESEDETAEKSDESGSCDLTAEKLTVKTDGDTAVAETDGFSLYTVEFTYDNKQYILPGDSEMALSEILDTVGLTGKVSAVEVSDESLFSAKKCKTAEDGNTPEKDEGGNAVEVENGTWFVFAHQAFSTEEWMKVTIGGVVYEITVTDTGSEITVTGETTSWEDGKTYKVTSDVTIATRISVNGNVTLNLGEGKTLTASQGIEVSEGNTLTIEGSGTLNATGAEIAHSNWTKKYRSGIGADKVGTIIINGGIINATGAFGGAGIGGDSYNSSGGSITINGGIINATGQGNGAGIGGGLNGAAGNIVINGGQVTATAAAGGAGIGSGEGGGSGGSLTLGWTDENSDFIEVKRWANSAYPFGGLSSISFAEGKLFVLDGTTTQATLENINKVGTDVKLIPTKEIVDISNAAISGVDKHYAYTGSEITVTPTVTLLNETLTKARDYTVSIKRNETDTNTVKEEGTYILTVTGTGDYKGSVSTTFYVNDTVSYQVYENGTLADRTLDFDGYDRVSAVTTAMTSGWHVVSDDVTFSDRISVSGDVNLVLCDGATLTANKGIGVTEGNSLTIYSQSGNTGKLVATVPDDQENHYHAAIGGDRYSPGVSTGTPVKAGTITIHGGVISATARIDAAGIGKAYGGTAGVITIYGGKITAGSSTDGTGIGGSGADIHLGWCRSGEDYIEAKGYEGSVTFDKAYFLDGTSTIATAENCGGKKIVPATMNTCKVTFDSNGGSSVASQTVVEGQAAKEPVKPIKQGYKFAGWYTSENFSGSAYDFSSAVNADLTLYARWETNDAISYIGAEEQTVSNFTEYTKMESGYTSLPGGTYFVSEDTAVSSRITIDGTVNLILGDGKALTAESGINVPGGTTLNIFCQSAGTGNLTANADYQNAGIGGNCNQNSGTVRIYGGIVTSTGGITGAGIGGGNCGSNGAVYIYGGTVTANGGVDDLDNNGCSAAIGGGQYGDGGIISILGGKVTANGGSNNKSTGIGYQISSTNKTATITLGYRTADDFIQAKKYLGTVTVESGKRFVTDDETPVSVSGTVNDLSTINGKKITPKKCTVTFDLAGAAGTTPAAQENLLFGIDKVERPADPIRDGYTFDGWKNGDTAFDFSKAVTGDLTLTAAGFTANTYKVHFDGNGATGGSMSDQSFTYDTAQNLTANTFTRTGYKFLGWSNASSGEKKYENAASVKNLTAVNNGTVNLYAVWQEKGAINPAVTINGWTYGETANEPGVTAESNPGSGTPTYEYFTDAACTVRTSAANSGADSAGGVPKNAGTYYIKATVPETDDYKAGTGSTGFTIAKAAINTQAINTPTAAANLTYTGSAQALITAGSCEYGEMQYALGTETGATQPYTASIPTATDAGTYYVWYKVVGDANHNDVAAQKIEITVKKVTITAPAKGKVFTVSKCKYKITDEKKYTVSIMGTSKKGKLTIGAAVKIGGKNYKITGIAAKAFKNNKNLTKVVIGKNISAIGKQAFYGCKNLKSIAIKTEKLTAKKVGSRAFKKISSKVEISVPKKKKAEYKKILKKKGLPKKAKVK